MTKAITLSHYDRGPIKVEIWEEATWWMGRRTWSCPDEPEWGSFEDEDFDEHYTGEINAILVAAEGKTP
jgi:hypothetical protein